MPDLYSSGYNAGAAKMQAQHTNWAQGLSGAARGINNTYGDIDKMINAVRSQEDSKVTEWVTSQLEGYEGGEGVGTEGKLSEWYRQGLLDPENMVNTYLEGYDGTITVESIMEGAGVSQRAAERWMREYSPQLRNEIEERAAGNQSSALDTVFFNTDMAGQRMRYSDPKATDFNAVGTDTTERHIAQGIDYNTPLGHSVNPNTPENNMQNSYWWAESHTKQYIEDTLKTGTLFQSDAVEYATNLFRENLIQSDDPVIQQQQEAMVAQLEKNIADSFTSIQTGIVNDSNARLSEGTQLLNDRWRQDPEYQMTDEEFDDFIRNTLGMDPDNNVIDERNASLLYDSMMAGNTAAAEEKVKALFSDPEAYSVLSDAIDNAIAEGTTDGVVHTRTYAISGPNVTVRDKNGEIRSGSYMPTYEEQTYTSSSSALNSIFSAYDRKKRSAEGAETIISTDYGEIVDMLPAEIRNDPEAFRAAVEYINNRGNAQTTLYSQNMMNQAVGVATDTTKTQQEKRDELSQMLANGVIDQNAYNAAIEKVNFAYEDDRTAVQNLLKAYITSMGDALPDELYNTMVSDPNFQDSLERWILSWRTTSGTLQSANPQQYVESVIGLFVTDSIMKDYAEATNRALSEIIDTDMLLGSTYALAENNPSKLRQMRDEGLMPFVRNDVTAALRQQIALADSSQVTTMEDIQSTCSNLMYGKDYDNLTDYQKRIVDSNSMFAIWDQMDFELLHDTFIDGQNLDEYAEVSIKTGDGTTVGVLGSDGFVYFLPTYSYDENQTASFFYVGTNSDIYSQAMSGNDVSINLAGYSLGYYKKPSNDEIAEIERPKPESGPSSINDWKDYISITPGHKGESGANTLTIDRRLWDVVNEDNIYDLLNQVARDPEYRMYYGQIQTAWNDWLTTGVSFMDIDQSYATSPRAGSSTSTISRLTVSRPYSIADDPIFLTNKQTAKNYQIRSNNA